MIMQKLSARSHYCQTILLSNLDETGDLPSGYLPDGQERLQNGAGTLLTQGRGAGSEGVFTVSVQKYLEFTYIQALWNHPVTPF